MTERIRYSDPRENVIADILEAVRGAGSTETHRRIIVDRFGIVFAQVTTHNQPSPILRDTRRVYIVYGN